MLDILGITFPIFAVVALGYIAVWRRVFGPGDMQVLGRFVMNIALPALIFSAVTGGGSGAVIVPSYVAAYAMAGLFAVALALLWFRLNPLNDPTGPARRAVAVMGTTCPNSAYMGYPVLLLAVPQVAAPAFAMNILVESLLIVPLCFLLLGASRPRQGRSLTQVIASAVWDVLRRPMVLGFLAGVLVSGSGMPLPEPVSRLITMIASATAPLALFVIGGTLRELPMRGNLMMAGEVVLGKLILHPALAALAAALLVPLGMAGLSEDLRIALILSAAMPMFGIYAILAQDVGHEGLAALGLFGATTGAFFTVSALLYWLL